MASLARRAELPPAAAQRLVVLAGLGGGVVGALGFLGPGSPEHYGVLSAPVFVYAAAAGLLVPGAVELLRLARVRVPRRPLGLAWSTLELDLGLAAAIASGLLVLTGERSGLGLTATILGSLGVLLGARRVP
jgi:hypothetical protein